MRSDLVTSVFSVNRKDRLSLADGEWPGTVGDLRREKACGVVIFKWEMNCPQ